MRKGISEMTRILLFGASYFFLLLIAVRYTEVYTVWAYCVVNIYRCRSRGRSWCAFKAMLIVRGPLKSLLEVSLTMSAIIAMAVVILPDSIRNIRIIYFLENSSLSI